MMAARVWGSEYLNMKRFKFWPKFKEFDTFFLQLFGLSQNITAVLGSNEIHLWGSINFETAWNWPQDQLFEVKLGGFKYCLFSSLLGEIIQFDDHIFQMGWFNHQLEKDANHFSPNPLFLPANLAPGRLATLSACCGFTPPGFLDLGMFSSQVWRLRVAWISVNVQQWFTWRN